MKALPLILGCCLLFGAAAVPQTDELRRLRRDVSDLQSQASNADFQMHTLASEVATLASDVATLTQTVEDLSARLVYAETLVEELQSRPRVRYAPVSLPVITKPAPPAIKAAPPVKPSGAPTPRPTPVVLPKIK